MIEGRNADGIERMMVDLGRAIATWITSHHPNDPEPTQAESATRTILHSLDIGFTTTHMEESVAFHLRCADYPLPDGFESAIKTLIETAILTVSNPLHLACDLYLNRLGSHIRIRF